MPAALVERRNRVVIERLAPEIDGGRFAIKRVVGEIVRVEADVLADGHDLVACQVLHWHADNAVQASPMKALGNDRWAGEFSVTKLGQHFYTVEGWVDHLESWRAVLEKRLAAGQSVSVDLLAGAELIEEAARRASGADAKLLLDWARRLRENHQSDSATAMALDLDLLKLAQRYPARELASRYEKQLSVIVEREKARVSTWYEVFPRSCASDVGRHGTLRDCETWLPYIAGMGFDVVYLPPIHPIGKSFRKGKNNSESATAHDVGSPWAIGSEEGGHKSVHPQLGTLEDFRRFVSEAQCQGLEVALDIALQCSPDHPYVNEHRD